MAISNQTLTEWVTIYPCGSINQAMGMISMKPRGSRHIQLKKEKAWSSLMGRQSSGQAIPSIMILTVIPFCLWPGTQEV